MTRYLHHKSEKKRFLTRIIIAIGVLVLLAMLLLARLVYLQIIQHKYYRTLSAQNAISVVPIPPRRGLIYDRHGNLLATNITVYNLVAIPNELHHLSDTLERLEKIIPLTNNEIKRFKRQLRQHRRFDQVPLKIALSNQQAALFSVNSWKFPGIHIQAQLIRHYPQGSAFAHVIGYVGRINDQDLKKVNLDNYACTNFIGKTGIEKHYECLLHGKVGYQHIEVDASGKPIRTLKSIPAQAGDNIYLTIDKGLQLATEKAFGDKAGAAVVIQVNSGQVLAMVSMPSFDPNLFVRGISSSAYKALLDDQKQPLYDRSIRGLYASGSTIKPFIALGALDDGVITPDYTIEDPGYFMLPNSKHVYHDWKKGGHGKVNVTKAIIVSCDTFFYKVGFKMGINKIDSILGKFGFGQKTGIDLPNELGGVLPSPAWKMKSYQKSWYYGDTVITSIGQGYMLVTPLELAVHTATLATRGTHYQPYLLDAAEINGHKIYIKPKMLAPVILKHPEIWQTVLSAMHQVISKEGTAWRFGDPKNYTAAAKTGTAQVVSINFGENYANVPEKLRPNSWIIVFAPYKKPEIAIAVLVEHHTGTSAPISRKIADYYFAHRQQILSTSQQSASTLDGTANSTAKAKINPKQNGTTN